MDTGSLEFRYSVIAASALYHHTSEQLVMEVSGISFYPHFLLDIYEHNHIFFYHNHNVVGCSM